MGIFLWSVFVSSPLHPHVTVGFGGDCMMCVFSCCLTSHFSPPYQCSHNPWHIRRSQTLRSISRPFTSAPFPSLHLRPSHPPRCPARRGERARPSWSPRLATPDSLPSGPSWTLIAGQTP
ncbi:hypothetical protein GDO81_029140 [Engystomops pustulosus]|uniref:Secreted protein n=1 Tax=Engystomops pustulosus TaxID=76066 RepID=A0AAV6Z4N4_ENGPU|nr:hypothetical protein GDO81_029140 [Engystomops pustulosus]